MKAQIVRASLHQCGAERLAERVAQQRDVFEEDLLLEILRAGGHENALAAENRGHEIGEGLAGAGPGFGDQRPATFDDVGDGRRHGALSVAWLVPVNGSRQRTIVREHSRGRGSQLRTYCSSG